MNFKLFDKVRNKYNINLIGTISRVGKLAYGDYDLIIDVRLNDGHTMYQCDPDNWELYFEVGDLITSNRSGSTYSILKIDDGWVKLKNVNGLFSNRHISDFHHASEQEKDKYYKEFHDYTVSDVKFEVGDIVKHKTSGKIYQIYKKLDDFATRSLLTGDKWGLERFDNNGNSFSRFVKTDDIQMASDVERLELLRLKESYETKEKLGVQSLKDSREMRFVKVPEDDITIDFDIDRNDMKKKHSDQLDSLSYAYFSIPLRSGKTQAMKEFLNRFYGACNMNFKELYPTADELAKEFMKEKETKEMTSYKIGDIVEHKGYYGKCIITDISNFEDGFISTMPLSGANRGKIRSALISNVRHIDDLLISVEDYNKMASTIEKLKVEKQNLSEDNSRLAFTLNVFKPNSLPEIKEVIYHKPATIILWKDGTKTVVKTQNKEKYDKEKGFIMAYIKKILGNDGNYYDEIKRWTKED